MTLATWAAVLFGVAIVLLIGELLLPTHGILGALGAGCILATIGFCFAINSWLGLGTLVATAIATPFAFAAAVQIWPKTPIGKRIMLTSMESPRPAPLVQVGDTGRVVSELRPMGICEFASHRVESKSEVGIIAAGKNVRIIALADRTPIVREI
jgi:membrane-bound ClpP family serine protease